MERFETEYSLFSENFAAFLSKNSEISTCCCFSSFQKANHAKGHCMLCSCVLCFVVDNSFRFQAEMLLLSIPQIGQDGRFISIIIYLNYM